MRTHARASLHACASTPGAQTVTHRRDRNCGVVVRVEQPCGPWRTLNVEAGGLSDPVAARGRQCTLGAAPAQPAYNMQQVATCNAACSGASCNVKCDLRADAASNKSQVATPMATCSMHRCSPNYDSMGVARTQSTDQPTNASEALQAYGRRNHSAASNHSATCRSVHVVRSVPKPAAPEVSQALRMRRTGVHGYLRVLQVPRWR